MINYIIILYNKYTNMNYTYDNKELFINIHQNDEYKEVINIEILDGINTYTSLCNIHEIEFINLFENDINILIDELKELFINNSFEITFNNNTYALIFFYTLSKKRKINISFNCTLIENENTINNTIVYLNNKISKMDYQIKQLTNKLNVYEPFLQWISANIISDKCMIYNNELVSLNYSLLRTKFCYTTNRKIKITCNIGNLYISFNEINILEYFIGQNYLSSNYGKISKNIDTTEKNLNKFIKSTYDHIIAFSLFEINDEDIRLFFDKTKLIIDYNNNIHEFYLNGRKHINIPLSEQLIADIQEQVNNKDKYYYEKLWLEYRNNILLHVPYATNDYYLLTNVKDNGYQYKLNREICDDLQVNFNAISHLYTMTYIK